MTTGHGESKQLADATENIMKLPGPAQVIKVLKDIPESFKANLEQRLMHKKVQRRVK